MAHENEAILFGSHARGDQSKRSDIELLLVQETSQRCLDRSNGLYAQISELLSDSPVDILIYTPAELKSLSSRKFIQTVLNKGRIIYEYETSASWSHAMVGNSLGRSGGRGTAPLSENVFSQLLSRAAGRSKAVSRCAVT